MQFSRATGSSHYSGIANTFAIDPSTGEVVVPPDDLRPTMGDRTHKFSTVFNYNLPRDFRSGSVTGKILRNLGIFSVFTLQSGAPSGSTFLYRGKWRYNMNLRIVKKFDLGKSRSASLFCEVFNALNRKNLVRYPRNYIYEGYSSVTGGVDWNWEDHKDNPKDAVRFNADFNGDGILTVLEAAKGAIASSMISNTLEVQDWGTARQIRLGAGLNF